MIFKTESKGSSMRYTVVVDFIFGFLKFYSFYTFHNKNMSSWGVCAYDAVNNNRRYRNTEASSIYVSFLLVSIEI